VIVGWQNGISSSGVSVSVLLALCGIGCQSGAGFATQLLTFMQHLSKVVAINPCKTFRTEQHAPSDLGHNKHQNNTK